MVINHRCYECGYIGDVQEVNKKITCPNCGTVNDVWLEGEEPPENHKINSTPGQNKTHFNLPLGNGEGT